MNKCSVCRGLLEFVGVQTKRGLEECWIKWSQCSMCSVYILSGPQGEPIGITREAPPKKAFNS